MSVEIIAPAQEIDDWEESGTAEGLNGLPEAVAPEKPAGAVEPPHSPQQAVAADEDDTSTSDERDARGRFTAPRHRAQSQRATKDDVETINALTARIKAAEEADGADIPRQDGESDRVYTLRRRAELAERRRASSTSAPAMPPQAASPPVPQAREPGRATPPPRPAAAPVAFTPADDPEPNHEDATKYPDGVYDPKFLKDHSRWAAREELRAWNAQQETAAADHARNAGFHDSVTAARAKYADFDAIAFGKTRIAENSPIDLFIMDHPAGADVLYYLNTPAHAADFDAIASLSPIRQLAELSLLAQRLTTPSVPAQVEKTGSTAAPARTASPRPPNPVRTAPVNASTEPPGDDDSLEAHERHYYPRKRRD